MLAAAARPSIQISSIQFAQLQRQEYFQPETCFCSGTLNSTEDIIACIQPWGAQFKRKITEDCLILNVWTPFPRTVNASVMVRFKFLNDLFH